MFDVLKSRIHKQVPEAVKQPLSTEEWQSFSSAFFGVFRQTSPGIQRASILFRYPELSALSEQQSRGLKTSLRETFLNSLDAVDGQTSFLTWLSLWSDTEDIIQHEKDHCTPYPENVRNSCRIALAAVRDEALETVELYGLMVAPPDEQSLSPRIRALAFIRTPNTVDWRCSRGDALRGEDWRP